MPNILIVDDSDIWRRIAADVLRKNSYHLVEADSGEQALELARHTPFDLLIMDYRMNRLDGLDTSKALRAIDGYEHVPVILITSEEFPGDCAQTPMPYVDGYIDKRHLIRELEDCVKLHLRRDMQVA